MALFGYSQYWGIADRYKLQEPRHDHRRRRLGSDYLRCVWGLGAAQSIDHDNVVVPCGYCSAFFGYDRGYAPARRPDLAVFEMF